ncbi:MAG TPA: exonuclease subunit SbcD [Chthoniobacteraceae bacterium]|nr:exonuclease subunit SbcD [Chthoniobacteraceae bacterium]
MSRPYRVVHTADWHLGKTLGDLDRTEEHRFFLRWLETFLVEEKVDALVIAGDLFDSANPPQSAIRLYFDFLAALHAGSACRVVVVAGNHDSPAHLEAPRDLLRLVKAQVVGHWPLTAEGAPDYAALLHPLPSPEAPQLIVAAIPFLRERELRTGRLGQSADEIARDLRDGLETIYRETAAAAESFRAGGLPVLATGHLTALGSRHSESEREIHVGGLGAIGADRFPEAFAYVALGHLHRPQAVGGRETIRYSGSPIALGFGEAAEAREIRLLEFGEGRLLHQCGVAIPPARQLATLRLPQSELAPRLKAWQPAFAAPLPPWLEVIVTGTGENRELYRAVQEIACERPFSVVRVRTEHAAEAASLSLEEEADAAQAHDQLGDPRRVFEQRLDAESLEPPQREALLTAFGELLSLYHERQRDAGGTAA